MSTKTNFSSSSLAAVLCPCLSSKTDKVQHDLAASKEQKIKSALKYQGWTILQLKTELINRAFDIDNLTPLQMIKRLMVDDKMMESPILVEVKTVLSLGAELLTDVNQFQMRKTKIEKANIDWIRSRAGRNELLFLSRFALANGLRARQCARLKSASEEAYRKLIEALNLLLAQKELIEIQSTAVAFPRKRVRLILEALQIVLDFLQNNESRIPASSQSILTQDDKDNLHQVDKDDDVNQSENSDTTASDSDISEGDSDYEYDVGEPNDNEIPAFDLEALTMN